MFSAEFALADYRYPTQNSFRFQLEGYDAEWSPATTVPGVRYTDIAPGKYILRVQARVGREDWSPQELRIPIYIAPAYYQRWWFWPAAGLAGLSLVIGLVRYRVFALEKRRSELEHLVSQRTRELEAEKHKSEELLLNILPAELAEELKQNGSAKARRHEAVTVMFSDFRGFTRISGLLEPEELVAEIDLCFRAFDEITERHGLEKIKTIGDAYLLVGGISSDDQEQAIKVVKAALEIQEFMAAIALERQLEGRHYFEARIGIHTGPLVAGIVGIKKFAYDIWGDTVNIASRMETSGAVGEVNISESTYALVKDHFRCEEQGVFSEHNTEVTMYFVKEFVGVG
jgi:class 3 adenylate cyclase